MNESTLENQWPKCTIAILNYNGRKHLETYLPSVLATDYPNLELCIIDNASTDDSVVWLSKTYAHRIKLIRLDRNTGYAGGYALGLEKIEDEFIVLLNSDVETPSNWLKPLITTMLSDDRIGSVQPCIKADVDRERFEYAGAAGGFIDPWAYPFCRGRIFDTAELDRGQYNTEIELFWTSGACMLIRKSAFLLAGGFDSDFFAHMEEIDLCWRMQLKGFKMMYCPSSTVYHLGGGTLAYGNPRKVFLNYRNNLLMMYKNCTSLELWYRIPWRLVLDGISSLLYLKNGSISSIGAIIKAHFSFYAMAGKAREKTRDIPKKPFQSLKGVSRKRILLQYFLFGKKTFDQLNDQRLD
jgi:GT2 family glycosyltransferase